MRWSAAKVICNSEKLVLDDFVEGIIAYCTENENKRVVIHTATCAKGYDLTKCFISKLGENSSFIVGKHHVEFQNGSIVSVYPICESAIRGVTIDRLVFFYTDIDENTYDWDKYFAMLIPHLVGRPDTEVDFYTPDLSIEPLERWHDFDGREYIIWGRKKIWGGKFSIES